jgi:two-component system NtrC family sensor kinase
MDIFPNISILVVDDEPGIREIMAATLDNDGFQVEAAAGGPEALARLAKKHYDLVVCDWMMPVVDGFDVLAEVKRRSPDTVFIFVTAYASVESAIAALRQGAYDYLLKPFDIEELSLTVQRAVSHRQLVLEKEQLLADLQERNASLVAAHAEARQRAEALSAMLEASHRLAHLGLSPEPLAQEVVSVARRYLHARVGITAMGGDGNQRQVLCLDDLPHAWQDLLSGWQFTPESLRQFLGGGAPISRSYYLDAQTVDAHPADRPVWATIDLSEAGAAGTAMLVVPLETHDGRVVGALWVLCRDAPPTLESVQRFEIFGNQVAGVIENANLFAALLRQLRARETLFQVSQRIVTTLDQQEVLQSILQAALKTMPQAGLAVIHHYPIARADLVSVTLTGEGIEPHPLHTLPYAAKLESLIEQVLRDRMELYLPEYDGVPHGTFGTLLILPMLLADSTMGTLSVVSRHPHAFSDDQCQLMTTLANQAAIALQNARLYAEARRVDELEALRDAGQAINQPLNLQQTLAATIAHARDLSGAWLGEIYLHDPARRRISLAASLTAAPPGTAHPTPHPESESPLTEADRRRCDEIADRVVRSRQAIAEPDLNADAEAPGTAPYLRAYLATPLEAGETLVGVLGVGSDSPGAFTADDLRLVQIIASQAANAIENAQLFEEVRQRWEQTEALRVIGQRIITSLDMSQVLELVVRSATDTISAAAHSTLYLLDQASEGFTLEASASRRRSQTAVGIEEARDRIIHLATSQHTIAYEPNAAGENGAWSLLAAPLQIGDTIIGAICLESPYEDAFSTDNQTLLSTFASQASIAIQNASLFRDLSSAYVDLANSREEILRSRNTLQALFDGITDGLYIVDQDMAIVAVNQAEAQRLGVPPADLQGRLCDEFFWGGAAAKLSASVQMALENGQAQSWLSQADAPDRGPFVDRDVHIYPILSSTGPAKRAIILAQDVSEMRQLQASLFRSANLAAVGQLASSIAHEINNPLTVAIGNAQILQLDMDESDADYQLAARIVEAGMRMRHTVQNLLDFSSQEGYQFDWIDLAETVEDALTLIAHPLRKGNVRVVKDVGGLPAVYGSANSLKLVWMNLLLNALDAIHARAGEGEIHIEALTVNSSALVRITDNGAGIPSEYFDHLFRPFFTTKPPGKGLGLGLYTCHTIISQHRGRIDVESKVGQGTIISVLLPLAAKG